MNLATLALAILGVLGCAWSQEGQRPALSLTPAALTVSQGPAILWSGRLSVTGCNEPGFRFLFDPLGSVQSETVTGSTWRCTKTLAASTAVCSLSGCDLSVNLTVRTKAPCRWLGVRLGGTGAAPRTMMNQAAKLQQWGAIQSQPEALRARYLWPSAWQPFRCAAWTTPTVAVCLSFADDSLRRVAFIDGDSPLIVVEVNLPAGGEVTLPFRVRISPPTASLAELVGRYASDFRAAFGKIKYTADARPVVQWIRFAAHHGQKPTPDNPMGFTNWRPDTDRAGAKTWAAGVADKAKANGFQGAIAWGFAWAPHHADYWGYPVDSRDLPTPARELYDSHFAGVLGERGLRWGCLQRAATEQLRNAAGPVWHTVDGSAPSAKRLAARLTWAGSLIYIDTTPDVFAVENSGATVLETVAAFREARKLCGPSPQWFLESAIDLCLPDAGLYAEINGQAVPDAVALARCVYPTCGVLAKDRGNLAPQAFRQWCDARGLAALVEDWRVGAAPP